MDAARRALIFGPSLVADRKRAMTSSSSNAASAAPAAPTSGAKESSKGKKGKGRLKVSSLRSIFTTLIWPRRRLLLGGLVLIAINRLAGLVLPGASGYVIDDVIVAGDAARLGPIAIALVAAVVAQASTSFGLTWLLGIEAQRLIRILRAQVQQHVIRLPLRFFDSSKSGELVSRVMTDVEGVRNLVGTGLVQLVGGVLTAIVAFVLLLNLNVMLTLLALIPMLLFGGIAMYSFSRIRPIFRERGKIRAEVTGRLTESLGGVRVVKGFNAEMREELVFAEGVERLFRNVRTSMTATSLVTSAATLLLGLGGTMILILGARLIMNGEMQVGQLFAFTLYLGVMISPILQMANIGTQLTEALAGLDRTEELLAMPQEGAGEDRDQTLESLRGDIEFQGVSFEYEEGRPVLRDVSFVAPAGSVTALVGTSGSGKTTLVGLAASFLTPSAGRVVVDGVDLARVDLGSYRSRLGVVLQDDFLFEGAIRDNILFGRPDASEDELMAAANAAYVTEFTDRFEDRLDTLIGERGVKLSGGQRQRLAIARAMLAAPQILILDEATSNLDNESEKFIQESLETLLEGRTTFVIAHRLSTIRQADQILVIEEGQVAERGTHDELIAAEGRYFELYTYQARI